MRTDKLLVYPSLNCLQNGSFMFAVLFCSILAQMFYFSENSNSVTDGPTDGRKDGRTDTPSYSDARTYVKSQRESKMEN